MANVFDAVQAINDRLRSAYQPGLTAHIGAKFLRADEAPPRVVWVPDQDAFSKTKSGPFGTFFAGAPADGDVPRPLISGVFGFSVHLWGAADQADATEYADQTAALKLLGDLVLAARDIGFGDVYPSSGSWEGQATEESSFGAVYKCRIGIGAPVNPSSSPVAQITVNAVSQNTGITNPDSTEEAGTPAP